MRNNDVLGIIFGNSNASDMQELTSHRAMASVPFGGKYRLVDFNLSNMTNSGITNIGIIVNKNFFSLMDHVGSGKSWDLSRKNGGVHLLPPFIQTGEILGDSVVESLYSVRRFLRDVSEEYVLLTECGFVANIDYSKMIQAHIENKADFTIMYVNGLNSKSRENAVTFTTGTDERIEEFMVEPSAKPESNVAVGAILTNRKLLLELVQDCISKNQLNYVRHIFQTDVRKYRFYGYKFEGYYSLIGSVNEYFNANMDLLKRENRQELFNSKCPIFTKVRDDMPSRYGLDSSVKNSLIAQGCIIEGEVENSIIAKGVRIGKGTKVSNCIIMQDTKIGTGATLNYVISDKDVVIKDGRSLCGYDSFPIYIPSEKVL
ncbi:MAG: glucose-1-phosphate adenylyltransferase subunit GlgD [Clostridia bacterium]|jgi:glucose-1-phosphate adenylyltransferase|nr:glucose-1-phosphate adenylyltransferase subunit GlgD [Clostridia bacterium]MEE1124782.1 glucose-1-phosphate adenylyltransferase subunit GlgD [Acutalibacteraceae bacterium]